MNMNVQHNPATTMSPEAIDAQFAGIAYAQEAQQEPQVSFNPQLMNLYLFMNRYSADLPTEKAEARKEMMTNLIVGDAVTRAVIEYNDAAQVNALIAKEVSDALAVVDEDNEKPTFGRKSKKNDSPRINAADSVRITA